MRNGVGILSLLLALHFVLLINGELVLSAAGPRNRRVTNKDMESIQKAVKIIKTFSTYIPGAGQYLSVAFGLVEIVVDRQVPNELRTTVLSKVQQVKEVCAGLNFEKIAGDTSALYALLIDALFRPAKNSTFEIDSFLEACNKNPIYVLIYSIPELIVSPTSSILKTAIEADPFHRLNTLKKTRKTILETVNTLAFLEAFRTVLAKDTSEIQMQHELGAIQSVKQINAMMRSHMANYLKLEYFTKVNQIVDAVMKEHQNKNESTNANELMKRLRQIHTNDVFVVIFTRRWPVIYSGLVSNVYTNQTQNVVIYRSKLISSMTNKARMEWGIATKNATLDICGAILLQNVRTAVQNIGFAIYQQKEGEMTIAQSGGDWKMRKPFESGTHHASCVDPDGKGGIRKTKLHDIYVYPA